MRTTSVVRALYGIFLLVTPHTAIRIVTGESNSRATATVVRVLGMRHLLQEFTVERADTRGWLIVGISLDIAHALSMVAVAIFKPDNRRLATLSVAWPVAGRSTEYVRFGEFEAGTCFSIFNTNSGRDND